MISDEERQQLKAFHRGLFFASEYGGLEKILRKGARNWLKLAIQNGEIKGNLYDASDFFKFAADLRDTSARALPNGEVMGVTRTQVVEYLGTPGAEFDWFKFSGMDKDEFIAG